MADNIQQLPIIANTPVRQVTATDPDAGSSGDGFLRDQPGKKQNKKQQPKSTPPPAENQAVAINPSVLLHDEVTLTRSARTIMGEEPSPRPAPAEPLPDETLPEKPTSDAPPAPAQHIHITA